MRIAIPTDGNKGKEEIASEHFGRCITYTIFDETGNIVEIIKNTSQHMGGQGLPPELLKKNKVDVLVCQGLGPSAINMCQGFGINVFITHGINAQKMFEQWKNSGAKKAELEDGCKDHHH